MTPKDEKYLAWCREGAKQFSTCAKRQYCALLVDTRGHLIGMGYNGGPKGYPHCTDGACPRLHEPSDRALLYDNCIAVHAEANALLHSDYTARREGFTLYVNGHPCFGCAKLIANSGAKRLVSVTDVEYPLWAKVREFLESAGVLVEWDS